MNNSKILVPLDDRLGLELCDQEYDLDQTNAEAWGYNYHVIFGKLGDVKYKEDDAKYAILETETKRVTRKYGKLEERIDVEGDLNDKASSTNVKGKSAL